MMLAIMIMDMVKNDDDDGADDNNESEYDDSDGYDNDHDDHDHDDTHAVMMMMFYRNHSCYRDRSRSL